MFEQPQSQQKVALDLQLLFSFPLSFSLLSSPLFVLLSFPLFVQIFSLLFLFLFFSLLS